MPQPDIFQALRRLWSQLRVRMAVSYIVATVAVTLMLEIIVFLLLITVGVGKAQPALVSQVAQKYALLAAAQGQGGALNAQATFQPHQPGSLMLPGATWNAGSITYQPKKVDDPTTFALLIAPNQTVLASSYPVEYHEHAPVATVLPNRAALIEAGLQGKASVGSYSLLGTPIVYAVEPVWNDQRHPIGAVYVEMPGPSLNPLARSEFWSPARALAASSGVVLLIIMLPIGALFGWLTTAGMARRIDALATATRRFAAGNYTQTVPVGGVDEIGQLEEHFNQMARQLAESIAQRQELAGQNARLAERSRIARDLHDSVKQQVFAIGMHLGTALSVLERDPVAGVEQVRAADALAYQTQQELTTLIQELRPLALQEQDICAALREYINEWAHRHGIEADTRIPPSADFPVAVETGLLRVAQEALANVARHSQARQARVTLDITPTHVTLTVADDGRGFTPETLDGAGVGLHSMRERMHALGGDLLIESAPGMGTRVVATCPLPAPVTTKEAMV